MKDSNNQKDEILGWLASLSPCEYDRNRRKIAREFNVRLAALDAEIKNRQREKGQNNTQDNSNPEPNRECEWPESVDGATLLNEIAAKISRHSSLSKAGRHAVWEDDFTRPDWIHGG